MNTLFNWGNSLVLTEVKISEEQRHPQWQQTQITVEEKIVQHQTWIFVAANWFCFMYWQGYNNQRMWYGEENLLAGLEMFKQQQQYRDASTDLNLSTGLFFLGLKLVNEEFHGYKQKQEIFWINNSSISKIFF